SCECGTVSTDQRIPAAEVQTEPRSLEIGSHRVEPQRDLCQFDRSTVQIHAIDLVQCDVCLDLLQLHRPLFSRDLLVEFLLTKLQIELRQLADSLHGE